MLFSQSVFDCFRCQFQNDMPVLGIQPPKVVYCVNFVIILSHWFLGGVVLFAVFSVCCKAKQKTSFIFNYFPVPSSSAQDVGYY